MKAIILARVSSKEQEDNNSIPAQVRRLQEYAQRMGLEVIETIQLVESSTKSNRHKFTQLINQIKRSKTKTALITDTIDRLQRDFRESVMLNELRNQNKIELHFVREALIINENSNSSEILRWDMGVMFAKSYVTQLSDNVKRSMDQKRRNGEWCGKAPYGYINIDIANGKKWIKPDPATAHKICKIFEWYAGGSISMLGIVRRLQSEYDTKKSQSNIHRILNNPFYYGRMQVKGQLYPHNYEPIISKTLFDAAQNRSKQFNKLPFKYAGIPYAYRGLISCGDCSCRITPERSKGLVYYHCTQFRGKHGAKYVREEAITEQLAIAFEAIRPNQEQFDQVMLSLNDSRADKTKLKERHLSMLQSELNKLNQRIDRNHDTYLDGDIEKDYYRQKANEYKERASDIHEKISRLNTSNDEFYVSIERIMNIAKNAPRLLESSKMEQKREFLNLVLQNLEIKDGKLRWEYKKPFDLMAFYKKRSSWQPLKDAICNPELPFEIISDILKPILDRHGYTPGLMTYAVVK